MWATKLVPLSTCLMSPRFSSGPSLTNTLQLYKPQVLPSHNFVQTSALVLQQGSYEQAGVLFPEALGCKGDVLCATSL